MNYYEVAIPIKTKQLFTYCTEKNIAKGCRVLINFNNTITIGFVWRCIKDNENKPQIKYKEIIEIIDEKPLLTEILINIAEWISQYYLCNPGIAMTAMLPAAIQIQTTNEIKKIASTKIFDHNLTLIEKKILNLLGDEEWISVKHLKKNNPSLPIYKCLEKLEDLKLIQIKRDYDTKIKPKYANYIKINIATGEIPSLTPKQSELYNYIKHHNDDIPLSVIAANFSYSLVKALTTKNLILIESRIINEDLKTEKLQQNGKNIKLTSEQLYVIDNIKKSLQDNRFQTYLLYGVTGSGKTEVYIRLISECLASSKNALVLVPEIALTPQMEEWFYNVFGDIIAIIHSRRSERERWEEWKQIKNGKRRIVLGARSAVFAPLENIGIIIVDEEHENSYKQDKVPRYNARDIAVLRAKYNNAAVVLGSATPSLESFNNTTVGKYELLKLTKRPHEVKKPSVVVIDMKEEKSEAILSELLVEKINDRLKKNEQSLLLLNRRGYASYVLCINCGKLYNCPQCDISLIFHSETNSLMCHYCGHTEKMIQKCPDCGSYILTYGTAGTQQLEKQLQIIFPSAKLLRMDTDTVVKKDSYSKMFEKMKFGNIDILFGTQMIAKGLDFEKVTLVGVISADNSLNVPDFRASEKTFQLLTQVAGRSGRSSLPGEVIIQTYNPNHYAIQSAQDQNFDKFMDYEMPFREKTFYPPYYRIVRIIFSYHKKEFLKKEMEKINVQLIRIKAKYKIVQTTQSYEQFDGANNLLLLGPVSAPIQKVSGRYRYHIIIKAQNINLLLNLTNYINEKLKLSKLIKVDIDVDPTSLL